MSQSTSLRVQNLTKSYKAKTVVNNLSLEVHPGEVVGLLGPNGAGKTTTFKMILGVEKPNQGSIYLDKLLNKLPLFQRARCGLGYLPQTPSVFTQLSVKDNLGAILDTLKHPTADKQADKLLSQFGLEPLADQKAGTLSGGERRKLEFARSLCANPKMLLVDEPFAAVDPIAATELQKMIRSLAQKNIGILLTDHSVRQSLSVCDRIYLIVDGTIVESGTSEEIRNSQSARLVYLGDDV